MYLLSLMTLPLGNNWQAFWASNPWSSLVTLAFSCLHETYLVCFGLVPLHRGLDSDHLVQLTWELLFGHILTSDWALSGVLVVIMRVLFPLLPSTFGNFKDELILIRAAPKDLNIGGSTVIAAIEEAFGTQKAKLREMYNNMGDLDPVHAYSTAPPFNLSSFLSPSANKELQFRTFTVIIIITILDRQALHKLQTYNMDKVVKKKYIIGDETESAFTVLVT
eukprot:Gb_12998 [translate_table: standard]